MLKTKVQALAREIFAEVVANRQHLHAHPELSFEETETAAYIGARLDELGISYERMAGNGLVGLIKGAKTSDRVIALRGDIDALPITESNDVPYKSQNPGVMHACGHDVHTSSLLGTAKILTARWSQLND
jgi:amidohydrolase